ncbi:MAG: alpha/beta fold hydrolase [Desulfobacterales bacterium]
MLKRRPIDISPFEHLYPFESHFMDLNGFKYHYVDEGSGDPVVMLHGNPTWSFYFRALIEDLSRSYRTIVPDHIGCGLSDKPDSKAYGYKFENRVDDLDALIENLAITEKITLVLHDWGGFIGMAYALRHPERICRFVLMNTAAFLPPAGKPIPTALKLIRSLKPLAALAVQGFNLFARGALFKNSYRGLSGDVKAGLIAPYNCWQNRIATLKFVQDIHLTQDNPSFRLVKELDQNLEIFSNSPILICWGEHDFVFDLDYLNEWIRRFPKAEVHRFAEAGHYVMEDVPQQIVALTREFLQRHPCREEKRQDEFGQPSR